MPLTGEDRTAWRRYLRRVVLPWFILFVASGIGLSETNGAVHESLYWAGWAIWVVMLALCFYGYRKITSAHR